MCSTLTQVSQSYDERAVFRCEHNTFHLAWDKGVYHLSLNELRYLYSLIEYVKEDRKPNARPNIHLFRRMTPAGRTFFELWIGASGLRLSFKDISILNKMLADVFAFLDRELPIHTPTISLTRTQPSFKVLFWN